MASEPLSSVCCVVRFFAKQLCSSELDFLFSGAYVCQWLLTIELLGSDRHAPSLTTVFSVTFYRQPDTLHASPTAGSWLQSRRPRNTRRGALLADAAASLNGKRHCVSWFTLPWQADLSVERWAGLALSQFLSERATREHSRSTEAAQGHGWEPLGPHLRAPVQPLPFTSNWMFDKLSLQLSEPQSLKL